MRMRYQRWFKKVGCFKLSASDRQREGQKITFLDMTCIKAEGNSDQDPCASGMPFFRVLMQDRQNHQDCMVFCLSKGLDMHAVKKLRRADLAHMSTLADVTWECRCGASGGNAVWDGHADENRRKRLNMRDKVSERSPDCEMYVWKYTGPMVFHSVPFSLQEMSIDDQGYVDTIAYGQRRMGVQEDIPITILQKEVHLNAQLDIDKIVMPFGRRLGEEQARARRLGLCMDSENTGITIGNREASCSQLASYCSNTNDLGVYVKGVCPATCQLCTRGGWLPCFPYQCAGGGPWSTKAGNGLIYIRYYWGDGIGAARQNAFRTAAREFQEKTCIRFSEQTNPANPRLRVYVRDPNSCDATVGFPGSDGEALLNMGWCKSLTHVGSLIHELGHIIGMNHEQNRDDGSASFLTPDGRKDAKLRVFWQNIANVWRTQYVPISASYVGSNNQGSDGVNVDTFSGYAEYDYESIMHYGRESPSGGGYAFSTVNPLFNPVVGQRVALSDGDLRQISDMYQCRIDGTPGPTPTASPTPTPRPPTPTASPTTSPRPTPRPTPPPIIDCRDTPPGWSCNGRPCTCDVLVSYCTSSIYGPDLKQYCPRTCGVCGINQCTDVPPAGWSCNGQPCTCSDLRDFCQDPMYGPGVSSSCRATCEQC